MTTNQIGKLVKYTGVATLMLNGNVHSQSNQQLSKPNIVLILADDLGTGDVNCYNERSKIKTPAMDEVAKNGVRFTDAHTNSAVSTPTRYGIITGRYCWRTRLKRGVLNAYNKHLINPERTTIASLLKESGYYTAGIGKWHLGMDFKFKEDKKVDFAGKIENSPNVNGFDYFYGITASLDFPPYVYIENDHFTQLPTQKQKKQQFPRYLRAGEKAENFHFETAWENLLEKAEDKIVERPKDKPMFVYFALPSPHKPVWPDSRFVGKTGMGEYGDFVHQTDYIVSRVVKKLKEEGIYENTLLIITSDNGSFMYRISDDKKSDHMTDKNVHGFFPKNHEPNYNYRGTKADVWEAGHRVPFLVSWPNGIQPKQVQSKTICTTDFLATFADLIGKKLNKNEGEDSFSFLPLLMGKSSEFSRAPIVNHSSGGMFAIRNGDYKLVLGNGSGGRQHPRGKAWKKPYQMFNLSDDIFETKNIIDKNKKLAEQMEKNLKKIIDSGSSKEM
jgi:arylsulfatase A-like enzyme